jgi:secondary thiamine-phosphate synthase enzyme
MRIYTAKKVVSTKGHNDCIDITDEASDALRLSNIRNGQACVSVIGSTAAITTMEYEPGLIHDLKASVERLFPENLKYAHHEAAGDDNGFSHLRASFLGPSITIPVMDGKLALGTWQQIILLDCDTRPRMRTYLIQILGD